ncbi:MAG TPA: hypothetical protein VF753_19185, partial [Terriglobales bacterium]
VDAYMLNAKINDCGLASASAGSGTPGSWFYNANAGCPGTGLQLTICRSGASCATLETITPPAGASVQVNVLTTQLSISYPYQWHFNNVLQLLIPGASLGLTNINTQATSVNMD